MTHVWAGLRRGRRPARSPSAPRAALGASARSPAWLRRPGAPQPCLRSFGPSGVLHTGGACAVVSHLEARPGSAAHGRRSQAPWTLRRPPHQWGLVAVNSPARPCRRPQAPQPGPLESQLSHTPTPEASHPALAALIAESAPNFARNSPTTLSNFEYRSLELQRLWMVSKSDRGKLCATYVSLGSCHRLWAPQLDFSGPSGAIHTSDAWRAVCCQARRCDSGQALPPPTGTAALSARLLWV